LAQQRCFFNVQLAWPMYEQNPIGHVGPRVEDERRLLAAVFQLSDWHEMTAVSRACLGKLIQGQHLRKLADELPRD
jgi:hypothetical protein